MNDYNLLYLLGLFSLSAVGLTIGLTIYGYLIYIASYAISNRVWPFVLLKIVSGVPCVGARVEKVVRRVFCFALKWGVPAILVSLVAFAVWNVTVYNWRPLLIEHGKTAGERLEIDGIAFRWIPMPNEDKSFWMMETEVTQGMWKRFMGAHPGLEAGKDQYPIEIRNAYSVKWLLGKLNDRCSVLGWKWTVPDIEQWSIACNSGLPPTSKSEWLSRSWLKETSGGVAHPVGEKEQNAWGLYDMVGNAAEACMDVGEMRGDILLAGLDYRTDFDSERLFGDWVMPCYIYLEEDGWIFHEDSTEIGWRLCLVPTPYAKVHSGKLLGFQQTETTRGLCNYVAIFGLVGLLLQLLMMIFGERLRAIRWLKWLLWLSVAEEFLRCSGLGSIGAFGFVRKWTMKFVSILFKYVVGQVLGFPISSLVASMFPSLPDIALSLPDALLTAVVIAVTFPLLLIMICAYKNVREISLEGIGRGYRYLVVPTVLLIAVALGRGFYKEYRIHGICDGNSFCVHPIHVPEPDLEEEAENVDL